MSREAKKHSPMYGTGIFGECEPFVGPWSGKHSCGFRDIFVVLTTEYMYFFFCTVRCKAWGPSPRCRPAVKAKLMLLKPVDTDWSVLNLKNSKF